jgi:hypothetical protein
MIAPLNALLSETTKRTLKMTNKNPRREGIAAGAAGKLEHTKFSPPFLPDQACHYTPSCSFLMDAQHVIRIPALYQTEREVLESRRQAERRAGRPSSAPAQKGRGHDATAVQPAPPAKLIPFPDKQAGAADGHNAKASHSTGRTAHRCSGD